MTIPVPYSSLVSIFGVSSNPGDIPADSDSVLLRAPDPEPRPALSHGGGTGEMSVRSFSVPLAGDAGGTEGVTAGAEEATPDPVEAHDEVVRASSGLRTTDRHENLQQLVEEKDTVDEMSAHPEDGEHSARVPLRAAGGTNAIAEEEVAESRPDPAGLAHRDRGDVSCLQIEVGLRSRGKFHCAVVCSIGRAGQGHKEDEDVDDDELADPQASYVFPEQKSGDCGEHFAGQVLFVFIMLVHIVNLREDEQLVVPTLYGEWIRPFVLCGQELRHVLGPGLVWRREMEDFRCGRSATEVSNLSLVGKTQYHRLVDSLTGEERVVRGPLVYGIGQASDTLSRDLAYVKLITNAAKPSSIFKLLFVFFGAVKAARVAQLSLHRHSLIFVSDGQKAKTLPLEL
ncbi:unnamed protein product [Symbiodinium necroappetens]|uniref:Uncharacterized protein n=1 Tax=Symbiodinium necroappetens TaxID=1628268 RepID=A0A813AV90_9DINO|nr:unnamed protein product [Symbiodinium necroappetens]